MTTFQTRLAERAKETGRIILANDYGQPADLEKQTIQNIKTLHPFLCAVKLNFHLLLPLGAREISRITRTAHRHGLQMIADIKLNDIGNTNHVTTEGLWSLGFDAVIANPVMGLGSLKKIAKSAHGQGCGVITLCHMSAPEARPVYDMQVRLKKSQRLYQLFLDWAISSHADGIIVGATYPGIIKYCAKKTRKKLGIFSPGVGTQGGKPSKAISAGSDYLIVGRTILNSKEPESVARDLQLATMQDA